LIQTIFPTGQAVTASLGTEVPVTLLALLGQLLDAQMEGVWTVPFDQVGPDSFSEVSQGDTNSWSEMPTSTNDEDWSE